MSNAIDPNSLLEYLAREVGCAYISDLRSENFLHREKLAQILESICPGAFTACAWCEAASYILHLNSSPEREEDARGLLRQALNPVRH